MENIVSQKFSVKEAKKWGLLCMKERSLFYFIYFYLILQTSKCKQGLGNYAYVDHFF